MPNGNKLHTRPTNYHSVLNSLTFDHKQKIMLPSTTMGNNVFQFWTLPVFLARSHKIYNPLPLLSLSHTHIHTRITHIVCHRAINVCTVSCTLLYFTFVFVLCTVSVGSVLVYCQFDTLYHVDFIVKTGNFSPRWNSGRFPRWKPAARESLHPA